MRTKYVIINPGTGPVWGGAGAVMRRNADRNMRALLCDSQARDAKIIRNGEVDDDGRYPYILKLGRNRITVDMPGLKLDRVRYIEDAEHNPWHFPRLYVDGSSWLWFFAIGFVMDGLNIDGPCPSEPTRTKARR